MPEPDYETRRLASLIYAGIQKLEGNPAVVQLGEFVWQANFQADPEALAMLISVLGRLEIPYGILQLGRRAAMDKAESSCKKLASQTVPAIMRIGKNSETH